MMFGDKDLVCRDKNFGFGSYLLVRAHRTKGDLAHGLPPKWAVGDAANHRRVLQGSGFRV
jgi:hypothetical protein